VGLVEELRKTIIHDVYLYQKGGPRKKSTWQVARTLRRRFLDKRPRLATSPITVPRDTATTVILRVWRAPFIR